MNQGTILAALQHWHFNGRSPGGLKVTGQAVVEEADGGVKITATLQYHVPIPHFNIQFNLGSTTFHIPTEKLRAPENVFDNEVAYWRGLASKRAEIPVQGFYRPETRLLPKSFNGKLVSPTHTLEVIVDRDHLEDSRTYRSAHEAQKPLRYDS
jgi:hypothetical protein